MSWRPEFPGERPTLGWHFLEFCDLLNVPDRPGDDGVFVPTREQAEFALRYYELDPVTGKRKYRRGAISRPRGWGKSPFAGAFCWFEALGDAVPAGWDADGRPVGKPWWTVRTPLVRVAAVSEQQTMNTWNPIHDMVTDRLLDAFPGLDPMETFVALPYGRGRMEQITASANTAKGEPSVFTLCDQIEVWFNGNRGVQLHNTLMTNLSKGRGGGHMLYTPNAFVPGTGSVAELLWGAVQQQAEGRTPNKDLLYDHREAPGETDLTDRESLLAGLRLAYGDSSDHPDGCVIHDPPCSPGWSSHDEHIARVWDPDSDEQEIRADFLNQITAASDSFVSQPEWSGCLMEDDPIGLGEAITLGFDGSRGRSKGKPDATALIGCRVRDGHLFQVGVWEAGDRPEEWASWEPSVPEIEAAIAECFDRYTVVGFYADPASNWLSFVGQWEARWGDRVMVKGRQAHPFEWWFSGDMTTVKVEKAVESFYGAVAQRDLSHDGSRALTRHVLNARRRLSRGRLTIQKESKASAAKIDACVAAVLAWQARLDAVAAGAMAGPKRSVTVPKALKRRGGLRG